MINEECNICVFQLTPNKKKKRQINNDTFENMEVESDVSNLSIQIEDMEIDAVDIEVLLFSVI